MITEIFSRSQGRGGYYFEPKTKLEILWFPELNGGSPLLPADQIELCPMLVGRAFVTLSEYIILWFLREIREGRLEPADVELHCDEERIRIDYEGELINSWPGGFYRERAALLFGRAQ